MEIWQTPVISDSSNDENKPDNDNNTNPGQEQLSSALVSCLGGYYTYSIYNTSTVQGYKTTLATKIGFQVLAVPVRSITPDAQWEIEIGSGSLLKIVDLTADTISVPITTGICSGSVDVDGVNHATVNGYYKANITFKIEKLPDTTQKWRVFFFKCDTDESTGEVNNKALFHKLGTAATFSPQTLNFTVGIANLQWIFNYVQSNASIFQNAAWLAAWTVSHTAQAIDTIENKDFGVVRDYDFEGCLGTYYKYIVKQHTAASINTQNAKISWQAIGGENVKGK